ncbi:MAG: hypothetical protein R6X20_12375 [Phycisphaerae bacterium]
MTRAACAGLIFLAIGTVCGADGLDDLPLNRWVKVQHSETGGRDRHQAPGPEVEWRPIDGEYVLRGAATADDLAAWRRRTDAWAEAVPPNTWVEAPAHGPGRPNRGRSWSSILYDPGRRQLLHRDGGHGSYHGSVTDHYDLATGRWFRSARREEPPWPHGTYFAWGRPFSLAPFCMHTSTYALFDNPLTRTVQRTNVKAPRWHGRREDGDGPGTPRSAPSRPARPIIARPACARVFEDCGP